MLRFGYYRSGSGRRSTFVGPLFQVCNPLLTPLKMCGYVTISNGTQPSEFFRLVYECEAHTTAVLVHFEQGSKTAYVVTQGALMERQGGVHAGDFLRIRDVYFEIVEAVPAGSVNASKEGTRFNILLDKPLLLASGSYVDAEVGYFYSDPSAHGGVSLSCQASRLTSTSAIDASTSSAALSAAL